MASSLQKGLSGAGAGASAGSFAGPYGAVIGGVIGGLTGLFQGSDSMPNAPLFSDINLQTDNPELYQQLQNQDAIVKQYQALYNQRSQGMTPLEQQQYNQTQADLGSSMAARGFAGTNAAQSQAYGQSLENQNNIAARQFQQQQALLGGMQGAQSQLSQQYMQALEQAYNAKNNKFGADLGVLGQSNATNSSMLGAAPGLISTGLQYYNGTGQFAPNSNGPTADQMMASLGNNQNYSGYYGGMPSAGSGSYGFNPANVG